MRLSVSACRDEPFPTRLRAGLPYIAPLSYSDNVALAIWIRGGAGVDLAVDLARLNAEGDKDCSESVPAVARLLA
jgi:hypothetical protein